MSKSIYLFKEHEKFQEGKGKLNPKAVFKSNSLWLFLFLLLGLASIWQSGDLLRRASADDSIKETQGFWGACANYKGESPRLSYSILSYTYRVDGRYYHSSFRISGYCPSRGEDTTLYYREGSPEEPSLRPLRPYLGELILSMGLLIIGIFVLLICFALFLINRKNYERYSRLRHSGILLEATILTYGQKDGLWPYEYAYYQATTNNGTYLKGRIDNRKTYPFPEQIQKGDSLSILYLNDATYCVL